MEDDEDETLNSSETFVEEEHEVDSDESFDDDYDEAFSGIKSKTPSGNFFAVSFGKSGGSSVAISNSFSSGKNGRVKSEAISYGSKN